MKTIVEYIVFDFKNVVSNDYKNRITFIIIKLKNVEHRQENQRLIEKISKIIFLKTNIC